MAGGIMDKLKKFLSVGDDYTDYSEEDISTDAEKSAADRTAVVQGAVKTRGNLVALPSTKSMPKQEIVVFNVVSGGRSSQTKGIADYLTQNKCVIVNVAAADNEMRRRTLDFLSGISFAMGGSKARVADYVYVFAPSSMTISNAQPDGSDEDSGLTPSGGDNGEYGDYEGYRGPYR
ncbi:MAG: cell division protein SepF [bacterium]|nr:cell division protein SepF [bacterium]